jgi:hypothetical protein
LTSRNDDFLPAVLWRVTTFANNLIGMKLRLSSRNDDCLSVVAMSGSAVGVEDGEEVKIGDGTSA